MGEVDRENRTMNCPKCEGVLECNEEKYAYIYNCHACGVQVLEYKFKVGGECIKLVLEVLDNISNYVSYFRKKFSCLVITWYLYKSRARGDCRNDSDIDIWMEVPPFVDTVDLNRKLIKIPLPWGEHKGTRIVWDFKFGVGAPSGTHYDVQSLRNLRATLLSS